MKTGKEKKRRLAELVFLTAIVILLQLLGKTIRIGTFSISLILLPVVTGAVLCGPWGGAWLGFVFGTVLMMTGETDAFYAISPLRTILSTAVRGALAGLASGLVYSSVGRKKEDLAVVLASITAPAANTGFFILFCLLFFYDAFASVMGAGNVLRGLITFYVSINFLIELALSMVLTPMLVRLVKRPGNRSFDRKADRGRNGKKLASRLTVTVILLGVLICTVSSVCGYKNIRKNIEKQYPDTAYPIVETEDSHPDEDVSVSPGDLRSAVRNDITNSIVMMICIEVIFITLYHYYISYRVIEPIRVISEEVSGFVENENKSGSPLAQIRTRDEIQQLAEDIVKMEKDIGAYIADITAITAERERIGAELNVAKKIQADMLPSRFPAFPDRTDFDIFASMDPAKEVGGDFYDFFLLDDDHIALVIADVSDKGVPAALFMVVAKTLLKNEASITRSPKQILEAVNVQLWENNTHKMFVTAWICILEISTGNCVAANAGHEYPAIRKANGEFELLKDSHGFVLGGIRKSFYSEYTFHVEKGGAVFVYTDGVTEAANSAEELFGTARMLDALNTDSGASSAEIIWNTRSAIDTFVGDAPQFDDITMLCVRRI